MPRSSKRGTDLTESPQPSKRARPNTTKVTEQVDDTANSPSGRLKKFRATAKVTAGNGTEIAAKVEKDVPQEKSPRNKLGKATATKAEVKVIDTEGRKSEKIVATKERGNKEKIKIKESSNIKNEESASEADDKTRPAQKQKRKTKSSKEAEMIPFAARTQGVKMLVGAHVSAAGGVHNSVTNSLHIGGNSFALFLKSQRKWDNPPLKDEHRDLFHSGCKEHEYSADQHVLPHGSYLVNLAQADPDKAKQAFTSFLDDLKRCEALGIKYYNFHPGNTNSNPRPEAIGRIADSINRAHALTSFVTPVLENMAASGSNTIGSAFEDLRDIIELVNDKNRVGICLDTCHAFAAGYDLRSVDAFHATIEALDRVVGLKYLKALHLNDSKAPFNSRRDLHQNIGAGYLGLHAFHNIMNEKRFEGLPMILETPIDRKDVQGKSIEDKSIWAKEIKLLESLVGMDANSDEFKNLEEKLAAQGQAERARIQDQVDRKASKEKSKGRKTGKKNGKKNEETDEDE